MNLTQTGFEDMDWIYLAKDTDTSGTKNLQLQQQAWYFLTSWVTLLFLLGVSYNVVLQGPLQNFGTY
jgi:hypothetical protein